MKGYECVIYDFLAPGHVCIPLGLHSIPLQCRILQLKPVETQLVGNDSETEDQEA